MRARACLPGLIMIALCSLGMYGCPRDRSVQPDSPALINTQTWQGYRTAFISENGRVIRPQKNDSVSEGQAYAMLRAVWMRDKQTFDRCYRWSEQHLSRATKTGDHLLAWHWKDGRVTDWMPASDADIDYALSLLLAETIWPDAAPEGCEPYGKKAAAVLADILALFTQTDASGRLYLLPWVIEKEAGAALLPQNPSYYSPAHFRIFYERSRDPRWLQLVDTGYYLLNELSSSFDGTQGVGLIPDWCAVDGTGALVRLPGKSADFGWEAVRVPLRIGLDWHWFKEPAAHALLSGRWAAFIASQWREHGTVYSEYAYDGSCSNPFEDPAFYASHAVVLMVAGSPYAADMLDKNRSWLRKRRSGWVYTDAQSYYVNSLAWVLEGLHAGIINRP